MSQSFPQPGRTQSQFCVVPKPQLPRKNWSWTINEVRRQVCSEIETQEQTPEMSLPHLHLTQSPFLLTQKSRTLRSPHSCPSLGENKLPEATCCQDQAYTLEPRGLNFIFNSFIEIQLSYRALHTLRVCTSVGFCIFRFV